MQVPDDFPKTMIEFEDRFKSETDCRAMLTTMRWPDGFVCPTCQSPGWALKSRLLFECAKGHQVSVTAGTIFHGTRKPLRVWFRAIFLMMASKAGLSACELQRLMGFGSYKTAWTWLHKLRATMIRPGRPRLEGVVEADETIVGGVVEGSDGRGSPNPVVEVAVELEKEGKRPRLGRVRMEVVEDASDASLAAFVTANIETGSTVRTDGFASYGDLQKLGYNHEPTVIGDDPRRAAKLFPGVHRIASLLKRWLLGTHQGSVHPIHLPAYLDEFTFRFNRRRSSHPGKLAYRLLERAVATLPFPYRAVVTADGTT